MQQLQAKLIPLQGITQEEGPISLDHLDNIRNGCSHGKHGNCVAAKGARWDKRIFEFLAAATKRAAMAIRVAFDKR